MMLSLSYNGENLQWVAVAGETQAGNASEPWYGKMHAFLETEEEDEVNEIHVTWLERCPDIKGIYYQLCTITTEAWIPVDSVILFGINVSLHFDKSLHKTFFSITTPLNLIKKIWSSKDKRKTFSELVKNVETDHNVTIRNITTVKSRKLKGCNVWTSERDLAKAVFEDSCKA